MLINGIDRIEEYDSLFSGKRLGLITSPTGLNREGETTIEILHKRYGLSALFSPEHGVRGNAAAGALVETYRDEETGVPVYSLYREDSKRLTETMLSGVDAVAYDIQDVGTRYYTFIYSMLYAMEDCAKAGKTFLILDRPNPLGGDSVEGNVVKEGYRSFIGAYSLCMRYGLTVGEFAMMANEEENLGCDLHVIPCKGWSRSMQYPDYGNIWVPPSPNIPRFESALLYPGLCLIEGTNLSEGRGTAVPFEIVGAPFVNAPLLAKEMNKKNLDGVWFRPAYFEPSVSKFRNRLCAGVQIHVTDRRSIKPVDVGVHLMCEVRRECEEFAFKPPAREEPRRSIDLLGGDSVLGGESGEAGDILAGYHAESKKFKERVRPYLFYE